MCQGIDECANLEGICVGATNSSENVCKHIQVTDLVGESLDWGTINLENIGRLYTCSDVEFGEKDLKRFQVAIAEFPGSFVETYVEGKANIVAIGLSAIDTIKGVITELWRFRTTWRACRHQNTAQMLLGGLKGIELKYGYEASFVPFHTKPRYSLAVLSTTEYSFLCHSSF